MAVTLYLYKFNKRLDSNANPTSVNTPPTSLQVNGRFLLPTSLQNPVIELTDIENEDIKEYNYAYIVEFKRYYFIANMSTYEKRWSVFLKEDLLGTYRTAIRESTQYVTRSYSFYNNNIVDNFYKTQVRSQSDGQPAARYRPSMSNTIYHMTAGAPSTLDSMTRQSYFHSNINNGWFIVGVLGGNISGVTYYCMDATGFKEFLRDAFVIQPSNMTDVSAGLKTAIYDPLQYITVCKWYPSKPYLATVQQTSAIYIGSQTVTIDTGNAYKLDGNMNEDYYMFFSIPNHYDNVEYYGSRNYLKLAPFIEYNIHSSMFGDMPLDTTKMFGREQVVLNWTVDFATGKTRVRALLYTPGTVDLTDPSEILNALMNMQGHTFDTSGILGIVETESGVTVPLASLTTDWKAGLGLSVLSFLKTQIPEDKNTSFNIPNFPGYEVGVKVGEAVKDVANKMSNSALFGGMSLADGMMAADRMWSESGGGGGHSFGKSSDGGGGGHSFGESTALASSSASDLQTGNVSYSVRQLLDDAMGLVSSAMGQMNSVGNSGSFVSYIESPILYAWCYSQQEYDDERFGRPLNRSMKLSTLSGICICKNAYITDFKVGTESNECWYPMQQEIAVLNQLLNSGIYLE